MDPEPAGLTYEAALALPDGLTLSKTDYSTNVGDPDVTLSVSGGSGSYTWLSENDAIATVSESGTVTVVSGNAAVRQLWIAAAIAALAAAVLLVLWRRRRRKKAAEPTARVRDTVKR